MTAGTRQKLSMIASVSNPGKARWMIMDGAFNHEKLMGLQGTHRRCGAQGAGMQARLWAAAEQHTATIGQTPERVKAC